MLARNKKMWWPNQESYILIPVEYVEPTTTQSTTVSTTNATQESTTADGKVTKLPPDDQDEDYPSDSASLRLQGSLKCSGENTVWMWITGRESNSIS